VSDRTTATTPQWSRINAALARSTRVPTPGCRSRLAERAPPGAGKEAPEATVLSSGLLDVISEVLDL
jgi:hypothetical protein